MATNGIDTSILTPLQALLNTLSPECCNTIYEDVLTAVTTPVILPRPLTVALANGATGEIRVTTPDYLSSSQPNLAVEYSNILEHHAHHLADCDSIVANVMDLDFGNLIDAFLRGVSPPNPARYTYNRVPIVVKPRFSAEFEQMDDADKERRVHRLFDWKRQAEEGGKFVPLRFEMQDRTISSGERSIDAPVDDVRDFVNGLRMKGYGANGGRGGDYFEGLRQAVSRFFEGLSHDEWSARARPAGMLDVPAVRETEAQMEERMRGDPEYGLDRTAVAERSAARYTRENSRRGGRERRGVQRM